jgi:KaiC/GvpD/RAD55 family RecA-like ATPase
MANEIEVEMMKTLKAMQEQMNKQATSNVEKPQNEWTVAEEPFKTELSTEDVNKKAGYEDLITKPSTSKEVKPSMKIFETGTVLDKLFVDAKKKSLGGIPNGIQMGVTGIAGSGKSILIGEVAIKSAAKGIKTLLVTAEDIFIARNSDRFDLQARLMAMAKELGLAWDTIKDNLLVMDVVANAELRDWSTFVDVYRYIVEQNKIQVVLFDSVTVLEAYRGSLKYRIMELCRFGQTRGITSIYINQRVDEDMDKYNMAGGIGIAHGLDATVIVDFGRLYYGDQIDDLKGKRGELSRFIRVMDCRMSGFVREHIGMEVTSAGLLRTLPDGDAILANYK